MTCGALRVVFSHERQVRKLRRISEKREKGEGTFKPLVAGSTPARPTKSAGFDAYNTKASWELTSRREAGIWSTVPTTLILVLASDEDLGDENIPALAGALLKLLVSAGDKQRSLNLG
jgi:hypothetical protein